MSIAPKACTFRETNHTEHVMESREIIPTDGRQSSESHSVESDNAREATPTGVHDHSEYQG